MTVSLKSQITHDNQCANETRSEFLLLFDITIQQQKSNEAETGENESELSYEGSN
jgi:hypothetical protein